MMASPLLQWEDQVVSFLSRHDSAELAKVLFQRCLISDAASAQFDSLNVGELDTHVVVRFLLKHVSRELLRDKSKWENFLSVLDDKSTASKELIENLTSSAKPIRKRKALVIVKDAKELAMSDASIIVELLACVSHKWELIAVALRLPKHVYENCRDRDNKISLSNIINSWLSGRTIAGSPGCNLDTLKTVLKSELVGETDVASELSQKFADMKGSWSPPGYGTIKEVESCKPLAIIMQSHHTLVKDGKSALLMVQTNLKYSVTYQWKKDGQPLIESATYSGVQDDILIISHANQATVGVYTCSICSADKEVCTNKISLTTLYPPGKVHLLNLYNKCREVPPDSWPPVGAKAFINLALIKSTKECTEMGDYCVLGDADSIIKTKTKVVYEDLLESCNSGDLILVEGRPGCGKTTLVHKIVKDWAAGKGLHKAKLVFLISLRIFNSEKKIDENLSEILGLFFQNKKELRLVHSSMEKEDGEGVCFLLDGLDEYRPTNQDKSVIFGLIQKRYLPSSIVIVSSRPTALADLQKEKIDKRVEVFGFYKSQIFEYIDSFPFSALESNLSVGSSDADAAQLKEYLQAHPNVFNMCYLPVHAAMICYLYKCEKGNIPCTSTKIYVQFSRLIVRRYLMRYSTNLKVRSELSVNDMKNFRSLCHIAFKMTVSSKQVIDPSKIGVDFVSDSEDHTLGLVTVDRTAELAGWRDTYTFLHLTFQEFLAAVHISKLDFGLQKAIIGEYSGARSMETVWKFYCGLIDFTQQPDMLDALLDSPDLKDLVKIGYAYESQQKIIAVRMAKKINLGSTLRDSMFLGTLSNYDMLALSYMVSCCGINSLNFSLYHLDNDKIRTLFLQLKNPLDSLKITSPVGVVGFQGLMIFLKAAGARDLKLSLSRELSAIHLHDMLAALSQITSRLELSFSGTSVNFVSVFNHFCPHQNLQAVSLNHGNIGASSVAQLIDRLACCRRLHTLDISHNKLGPAGAVAIAARLFQLPSVKFLFITNNDINLNGALEILKASKSLLNLTRLYISERNSRVEGEVVITVENMVSSDDNASICALVKAVQHNTQDRWLYLGFKNLLVKSVTRVKPPYFNLAVI